MVFVLRQTMKKEMFKFLPPGMINCDICQMEFSSILAQSGET